MEGRKVWYSVGSCVNGSDGDSVGCSVGNSVGASDGDSVGCCVGSSVGLGVRGAVVGEPVGAGVGTDVRMGVGEPVGLIVRIDIGAPVGAGVGADVRSGRDGSCVGTAVGDWVGDSVGCTVGICVGGCEGNCVGDAVGGRVGVAVQRQHELIANAHQHDADGLPTDSPEQRRHQIQNTHMCCADGLVRRGATCVLQAPASCCDMLLLRLRYTHYGAHLSSERLSASRSSRSARRWARPSAVESASLCNANMSS